MKSGALTLLPADEARRVIAKTPPVGHERVPIAAAAGRVLAAAFARRPICPASGAR